MNVHCLFYVPCDADTSLLLSNVRRSQRGFYQCFASNQVGTAHASINLNVLPRTPHLVSGMFVHWDGYHLRILADKLTLVIS